MLFSELYLIMVKKLTFVRLRRGDRPNRSAQKIRGNMSLQKPKPTYATSERQYIAAGQKVEVPWAGIHE